MAKRGLTHTADEAREAILAEFLSWPPERRRDPVEVVGFAIEVKRRYRFKCKTNRFHVVMGWLKPHMNGVTYQIPWLKEGCWD